jgi:uncharacterized protein with GYD domain
VERSVTLIRVAPTDREPHGQAGDLSTRIAAIVESLGGTTEGIWTFAGGPYRFVSVATYPDRVSAVRALTQIEALGVSTVEGYPVVEMREYLQAMAA